MCDGKAVQATIFRVSYLTDLGFRLPRILSPARRDPRRPVTADVMADTALLTRLAELGDTGARRWPHGVSAAEEEPASATGLPPADAGAAGCKKVDSEIHSRLLADRVGLRQPDGRVRRDVTELTEAGGPAGCVRPGGVTARGRSSRHSLSPRFLVGLRGIPVLRGRAAPRRPSPFLTRRAGPRSPAGARTPSRTARCRGVPGSPSR